MKEPIKNSLIFIAIVMILMFLRELLNSMLGENLVNLITIYFLADYIKKDLVD